MMSLFGRPVGDFSRHTVEVIRFTVTQIRALYYLAFRLHVRGPPGRRTLKAEIFGTLALRALT